jgi:lipopolysaccharide O-acetyltransferase
MKILKIYGFIGIVRLVIDLALTKLFYSNARLVRFPIYLRGRSFIKLGKGLTTGVNIRIVAFPAQGISPVLEIGDNVQINDSVHIGAVERIYIGNNTLIASRVFISDHNHGEYRASNLMSSPDVPPAKRPLSSRPVYIGNNVWLGEQVSILSGVTIGDGAIIGANSVVVSDIPPNTISVGNPAKVIRYYDFHKNEWLRI